MNELSKHRLQRWFQRRGLRLESARHAKFSYDACNFGNAYAGSTPVIFDVGANIGQTSEWFSLGFPQATIYAFEPFQTVFERLRKRLGRESRIRCVKCALGARQSKLQVARLKDPFFQCGQIIPAGPDEETEEVSLTTVDSFCQEESIPRIFILKTDTEGSDLDVLRGAEFMLKSGRVTNVLSEACFGRNDGQHTNLFALLDYLLPLSFEVHGLYDLHHSANEGRLEYFNVLFRFRPA